MLHQLRDPEPFEVIQADIKLRVDAICKLNLKESLVNILIQQMASAAHGKRRGDQEIVASVKGFKSIILDRLPYFPAYVPEKVIMTLVNTFLRPGVPPMARTSASHVLSLLSATKCGQIIIHPTYIPTIKSYSCRGDGELGNMFEGDDCGDRLQSSRVTNNGDGVSRDKKVTSFGQGENNPHGCVGPVVGSRRGYLTPEMSEKPRVSPFLFVEHGNAANGIGLRQASSDTRFLPVHKMVDSLLRAIEVEKDREALLSLLQALEHVVLDTSLSRNVDHAAVLRSMYNCCSIRCRARTPDLVAKLASDLFVHRKLCRILQTSATHVGDFSALARYLVESQVKESAQFVYAATLALVHMQSASDDRKHLIRKLLCACNDVLACRDRSGSSRSSKTASEKPSSAEYFVAYAPDEDDFAALESLFLLLAVTKSTDVATQVIDMLCKSVALGRGNANDLDINQQVNSPLEDVWRRWRHLALSLFISALELLEPVSRSEICARLDDEACSGNVAAALMVEHCICFQTDVNSARRWYTHEYGKDLLFYVHSQPLPYLLSARLTSESELFICQRRASGSSISQIVNCRLRAVSNPDVGSTDSDGFEAGRASSESDKPARVLDVDPDEVIAVFRVSGVGGSNPIKFLKGGDGALEVYVSMIDDEVIAFVHKIGVVYVGPGEDKQDEILSHSSGSKDYTRFLRRLGSFISVRDRPRAKDALSTLNSQIDHVYLGDLRREHDGPFAFVHRERSMHVAFHVATMIPSSDDDLNRRIGQVLNEKVLIVWNESGRRFDPGILRTQCVEVLIVISPTVASDRYRVKVLCTKPGLARFGPLQPDAEGYVLSDGLLPSLVRLTAVHANTVCYTTLYRGHSFANEIGKAEYRAGVISDVIGRFY